MELLMPPSNGSTGSGPRQWMSTGPIRWQPSELAKLGLILVGADICVRKGKRLRTWKDVMVPFGIGAGIVGGLVMMQPDLGTTLILAGVVFVVLYLAGTRMRVIIGMGFAGTASALLLSMSEGYRRARLQDFWNPFKDPLNAGYQAVQSQIALGSGGLFGVGLGASRPKGMEGPNAHT